MRHKYKQTGDLNETKLLYISPIFKLFIKQGKIRAYFLMFVLAKARLHMKKTLLTIIAIAFSINLHSQYSTSYPDTLHKRLLLTTIGIETGAYIGGLSFLSFIWYKDRPKVPFHYYNDWQGYLQMDKCGHAYAAYYESSLAYHALRKAGVSKKKALIYGGPAGLVFQTPIEVFDGLNEGWGFSWTDMAANTFGAMLFTAQEAFWDNQIVRMKFSYSPSLYREGHPYLGETHLESFFLDYNAHTYWLSGNLKKLTGMQKVPDWLNVAVGYSANGMIKEFYNPAFYHGNPIPNYERHRQYLLSLDMDLSKIKTKKRWLRAVFTALNLIKIPFPALEYNQVEGLSFRPFYF